MQNYVQVHEVKVKQLRCKPFPNGIRNMGIVGKGYTVRITGVVDGEKFSIVRFGRLPGAAADAVIKVLEGRGVGAIGEIKAQGLIDPILQLLDPPF